MMQTTTITTPETSEIDQKATDAVTRAQALAIDHSSDYQAAGAFLTSLKRLQEVVSETFDPAISAAHNAHRAMLAAKKIHAAPLEKAEQITKDKMLVWHTADEARRKAERDRIEAELRAKAEEARRAAAAKAAEEARIQEEIAAKARAVQAEAERVARLEAATREDAEHARLAAEAAVKAEEEQEEAAARAKAADAAISKPIDVGTVKLATGPAVAGVTTRTTWKAEVFDFRSLVVAVAEGRAPISLLLVSQVELKRIANEQRENAALEGVHFFAEIGLSARSL